MDENFQRYMKLDILARLDVVYSTNLKPNIRWDYDGIENDPKTNIIPVHPIK